MRGSLGGKGSFETGLSHVSFEIVPDPPPQEILDYATLVQGVSDVPVAFSAIRAGVLGLVSDDKDLTHEAATQELRTRLRVLRPVVFLHVGTGRSPRDLEQIWHRHWPIE